METPRNTAHIADTAAPDAIRAQAALEALPSRLLSAQACRVWLSGELHPAGPACPRCGDPIPEARRARFADWGRLQCAACGAWFSATTGTVLQGAKLSAPAIVALAVLLAAGMDPAPAARALGINPGTARQWAGRLEAS